MTTIQAKGHTGTVEFDGQTVTINRTGLLARAAVGKGTKQIPVRHITAVQFKPAGFAVNGFIQFTLAGGIETKSRFGHSTTDAAHDENAVVFTKFQTRAFEQLRDAVQAAMAAGGQPAPVQVGVPDVSDRMRSLRSMLYEGLISADEFDAKRAELLGQI